MAAFDGSLVQTFRISRPRATSAFESAGSGGQRDLRAAAGLRRQRPVLDDAEHTQDEEDDEQRDDDANDS
jgi:hypothetical protein